MTRAELRGKIKLMLLDWETNPISTDIVVEKILSLLPEPMSEEKLYQCKYAHISHGIGIDNKVTEVKLHCEMNPENDYTEVLSGKVQKPKQEWCECKEPKRIMISQTMHGEPRYAENCDRCEKPIKPAREAIEELKEVIFENGYLSKNTSIQLVKKVQELCRAINSIREGK